MQAIPTTTTYSLVAISVLTAIVASYAAFGFAERMASSKAGAYWFWLTSGAAAMGLGIWSMHYLGMLAVHLPIDVYYHVPTVVLSLLFAVLASAVVLLIVSKKHPTTLDAIYGSLIMGSGIGLMHYTGMHAMRCAAMHRYDLRIVALSVVVAVAFSWMALQISFTIRQRSDIREWLRLAGAAVMGLGISAMHYTAMAAVTFVPDSMPYSTENTIRVSTIGVAAIVFTSTIVLFGALLTTFLDRRGNERLQRLLEQLSEERDRFSAAAESSMDALCICSAVRGEGGEIEDFAYSYLNSNLEKMIALPRDRIIGRRMCDVVPINRTLGLFERYKQVVLSGDPLAYEFAIQEKDVPLAWIRIQAVKVRDGVAITSSDITARRLHDERILYLAHHDSLTGLLNRSMLSDRIDQAIEYAKRHAGKAAAFMVDLDKFKQINDTLGHAAGDSVLATVAARLKNVIRAADSIIRVGGDEFVVVIGELRQFSDARIFGEKLVAALQPPMSIGDALHSVTCSVGGAVYPDSAIDRDALLSKADLALYAAKEQGKNQFHIYSTEPVPYEYSQLEQLSASE
jgi:diguanylate cyclase (GGDEF)-like protein